LKEAYLFKKIN